MHDDRAKADEFYVGYLPTPPGHLRVVRVLVVLLGLWIIGLGAVMAAFMRDPGPAAWDLGNERTWTGVLAMAPYPMVLPADGAQPLLIVEMGKHGAHERAAGFDGVLVDVTGFLLERDGRRIIEVTSIKTADATAETVGLSPPALPRSQGATTALTGEIVDGKCYLGSMKPGDGLTHKSCATLCIRGGLPPMFVMETPDGPEFRLLIVNGLARLPDDLLPLVAERVRLEGELIDLSGMPAVRVDAAGIALAR